MPTFVRSRKRWRFFLRKGFGKRLWYIEDMVCNPKKRGRIVATCGQYIQAYRIKVLLNQWDQKDIRDGGQGRVWFTEGVRGRAAKKEPADDEL